MPEETKPMTPEQFAERMEAARQQGPECGHIDADDAMCELLESLGYGVGVAIFRAMGKWYA